MNVQQGPMVVPLVSEAAVITSEPEIEEEAQAKHDLPTTLTATEEAPVVSNTSEPAISYAIEETPTSEDCNLVESESSDDDEKEDAVDQSGTIEPRATEPEYMFSPVDDDKTDVSYSKTSDSATPIHDAAAVELLLPEVVSQEIIQPPPTTVPVTEDVLYDREIIASSTKVEEHGTPENVEAEKDFIVEEVGWTRFYFRKTVLLTCLFFFFFLNKKKEDKT